MRDKTEIYNSTIKSPLATKSRNSVSEELDATNAFNKQSNYKDSLLTRSDKQNPETLRKSSTAFCVFCVVLEFLVFPG